MRLQSKNQRTTRQPRLGVDIGGVLIGATNPDGHRDTRFLQDTDEGALATPAVDGAEEALRHLVEAFEGRVWLVSKCGERIERRSRAWLEHHQLYERTGLCRENLRFCRRRPQKRIHASELELTHFVDDRIDVLKHLKGAVEHLFLFGHQPSGLEQRAWVTAVADWEAALPRLLRSLAAFQVSSGVKRARGAGRREDELGRAR